jgi:hypothetical protein
LRKTDGRQNMNKQTFISNVTDMLNTELASINDNDEVTEELFDNVEAAFSGVLENAKDEEDLDEE